jgi:hypothetical protein
MRSASTPPARLRFRDVSGNQKGERHRSEHRPEGVLCMQKLARNIGAAVFLICAPLKAWATDLSQTTPLSDLQWDRVYAQVSSLDKVAYLPSLLPVIMKHRNAIGLSYKQTRVFRLWQKENHQRMVDLMDEIIQRRIELSSASLDARTTGAQIDAKQWEIFGLQEQLLRIRLSCRQIMTAMFSAEQWNNLGFVLEEYPKLSGLLEL